MNKIAKISLFENKELLDKFIQYSQQDSISLLKALIKAQNIYINEHQVDLATIWSTGWLPTVFWRLQTSSRSVIPGICNEENKFWKKCAFRNIDQARND